MGLLQVVTQGLGKESMIAIPLSLAVKRDEKDIGLLEPAQGLLAVSLLHDGITQRDREALQNGCGKQKGLHFLRLTSQYLLSQIVQDVALIPTGLLQQAERISLLGQGKTQQLHSHQPALDAIGDLLDRLLGKLKTHHFIKEGSRLLPRTT